MKKIRDYVISISYGNYNKSIGGTDKVILSHQELFNNDDISMIHLYGLSMKYSRFPFKRNDLWKVLEDGKERGIYTTYQLCRIIWKRYTKKSYLRGIYIHHLRDINLKELSKVLSYTKVHAYLYIHDYMLICPKAGLIDSNNKYCGSEIPNDIKCRACLHYDKQNAERTKEIREFFETNAEKLSCIAPSVIARDIWCSAFPQFNDKVKVIPHQRMVDKYYGNQEEIKNEDVLKVAFVGSQSPKKGWEIWENAVKKAVDVNCKEKFFHFGFSEKKYSYIQNVEVDFHNDKDAMINCLRENEIHVAVLWSLVPETYSYTFFETYASNCFVLTNKMSGNISAQTEKLKNGLIMNDINDLVYILRDEMYLRKIVNDYRKQKKCGPQILVDNGEVTNTLLKNKPIEIEKISGNNIKDSFYTTVYQVISGGCLSRMENLYHKIR